nr:MAG TPA: hypothetical protein [Caudoviricetes sp.]
MQEYTFVLTSVKKPLYSFLLVLSIKNVFLSRFLRHGSIKKQAE